MHDIAGILLFIMALFMLFALDALLLRTLRSGANYRPEVPLMQQVAEGRRPTSTLRACLITLALFTGVSLPPLLQPELHLADRAPPVTLEKEVPAHFADWRRSESLVPINPANKNAAPGNQTLSRSYINNQGDQVMLSISYGRNQIRRNLQLHRPEYCYTAQGFTVSLKEDAHLSLRSGTIPVRRLLAKRTGRLEPITYWITVGDKTLLPGFEQKLTQWRYALNGTIPDGMLFRVSSISADTDSAYIIQAQFIRDLQQAIAGAKLSLINKKQRSSL
jgi:EpsI family protein